MDYKECWDLQEGLMADALAVKKANKELSENDREFPKNHLILVEHPHVYTLGKSGDEGHLLLDDEGLAAKEALYYKINRGGDITYHGPGQIVAYPIFDLEQFFTDIHRYMRYLEEAIIRTVAEYGIKASRIDGLTGVWLDWDEPKEARKIAALGVKSSRWMTMHGLALNVNTDLSYFGHIVPCGIDDKAVTSMQKELGREVDYDEVKKKLSAHLAELFGYEYQ